MNLKLEKTLILITAFTAFSIIAQEFAPIIPPDKEKVSYALGMQMALEFKPTGVHLDPDVVAQSVKDVLEGKPTVMKESDIAEILNKARQDGLSTYTMTVKGRDKFSYAAGMRRGLQLQLAGAEIDSSALGLGLKEMLEGKPTKVKESEIEPLFKQAQAYALGQQSKKNKAASEDFLAKNAKEKGVKVMPDGLQYKVLEAGNGEKPTTNDLIIVKYRGTYVNGTVFDYKEHFLTRSDAGTMGMQEALQQMRVGSKWQIFVPSDLAFGHKGEQALKIGPDSTLIYDLELVSMPKPGDPLIGTGTVGHGLDGEYTASNPAK
ncbi:FKBP-type peptidyl-prolyl cis-trans isomerase N-terminal domain-containing protein [Pedosphaera parvula]|uniref:Peptidyl-prolyl cis-trans isomerase n=1 Tax=Pedosphaera parvula (strain Ellin514) TaxID=320771 RepID=B9XMR1_PEDPL|nr:FKBP-type peptidyl-prolyl cis-trans isomerase N-terminal domain-containing protein [Pedosphaera parvula]EEF58836.1 peptidylprolyl isomerase FKBP-type [Pedosphaera parvula Ellin514]